MHDDERRKRAEARRDRISIRKATLGDHEHDFTPVFGGEAVSLVTLLTAEAWSLSARPLPRTDRRTIPVRFVRGPAE